MSKGFYVVTEEGIAIHAEVFEDGTIHVVSMEDVKEEERDEAMKIARECCFDLFSDLIKERYGSMTEAITPVTLPPCAVCDTEDWCGDCPEEPLCMPNCSTCDITGECKNYDAPPEIPDFEEFPKDSCSGHCNCCQDDTCADDDECTEEVLSGCMKQEPEEPSEFADQDGDIPFVGDFAEMVCDVCDDCNDCGYAPCESSKVYDGQKGYEHYGVNCSEPEDIVKHPSHYAEADIPSGIECWLHYELAMTEEEFAGAMKSNVYKYIFRAGRKDPSKTVEDLEKAKAYLNRWIDYVKGNRVVWMRGKKNEGL